jgi:spore maturation protein CgeB
MSIERIAFLGKSKARTREARFMVKGMRRLGKRVLFLNVPRIRRRLRGRDLDGVLLREIERFQPQLVLSYSKDAPDEVLSQLKGSVATAMFWPDYVEQLESEERLLRKGRLVDVFFMTNKGLRDELIELGVSSPVFCPQACDDDEHRRVRPRRSCWKSDVAFVGRPHKGFREEIIKSVHEKFNLKVWGGDWRDVGIRSIRRDIRPREFAKICGGAKIVLGCDMTNRVECYFSFRTWQVLGCGGFLLTDYVPGLETMFRNGEHLVWYKDGAECLELIDYYLGNEEERGRISDQGFEFVHRTRNYPTMMREMLDTMEKLMAEEGRAV